MKHKYVQEFICPEEELKCDHPIIICMNDNKKYSIREYREKLYEDIAKRFNSPAFNYLNRKKE